MTAAPLPFRRSVLLTSLLFAVCFCWAASTRAAEPAEITQPKIADARIGFNGAYKLGCWTPLTIELQNGPGVWNGILRVTVPDTDGVPTHVSHPVQLKGNAQQRIHMVVRVGQASSPITISLLAADGKLESTRSFFLGTSRLQDTPGGYPSTNRLVGELGGELGLDQILRSDEIADAQLATRIANVEDPTDLPTQWYGYESLDTVLLSTSEPDFFQPFVKDSGRLSALEEWVRRGGQLVLFCGANAEGLLANEGPLSRFAPGRFEKMESLTQPQPLAIFSGSDQIGKIRRINLPVPSLLEVDGQILASAGRSDQTVPLVVRTCRGLGEIVFVGVDFDQPPLRDWEGRGSFLRRVLQWQSSDAARQSDEQRDSTDLTNHLRNSLDKQFVGVSVIPFGLMAFLAAIYIMLIGPGDYVFVRRALNRPSLTWLTFPLIVLSISAIAYTIANRMKGDQLRVNQVEIIDVDSSQESQTESFVRGTVFTHFFTPEVSSLDLELSPSYLESEVPRDQLPLVSWLGLPGSALGGMQASGSQTVVFDDGYQLDEQAGKLQNLPVQIWSTKTLTARWSATVAPQVSIELRKDGEELVQGKLVNNSKVPLADCALLYRRWAFRLGTVPAGKSAEINDSLRPRTARTLLTNASAGDETAARASEDGTVSFFSAKWDVARLLKVMMFYETVNGAKYTGMVDRYQPFLDLSPILQHDDRAILIARTESPGSQWQTATGPLASDQDRRWTFYRFVVKVEEPEED